MQTKPSLNATAAAVVLQVETNVQRNVVLNAMSNAMSNADLALLQPHGSGAAQVPIAIAVIKQVD